MRARPPAGGRVRKNFFGRPGLKRFLLASRQQENCSEIPQPGARQFWNLGFTLEMLGPCSAKSGRLEFGQQICEFATAFFSRVPAGCRNPKLRSVDFRILAAFFLHDSPAVIYAKKRNRFKIRQRPMQFTPMLTCFYSSQHRRHSGNFDLRVRRSPRLDFPPDSELERSVREKIRLAD